MNYSDGPKVITRSVQKGGRSDWVAGDHVPTEAGNEVMRLWTPRRESLDVNS